MVNNTLNKKGLFITFEGPDGSGKTTIIKELYKNLNKRFKNKVVLTREPGGNKNIIAESIRNILLNTDSKISYRAEALLFAASRAQHIDDFIVPSLKKEKIILCDRFVHSSYVYQGIGRKLGIDNIKKINEFAMSNVKPDLTIFLMINPIDALNRIKKDKNREINRLDKEKVNLHKQVYQGYLKLIKSEKKNKIFVVDANKSVDEITDEILKFLNKKFFNN